MKATHDLNVVELHLRQDNLYLRGVMSQSVVHTYQTNEKMQFVRTKARNSMSCDCSSVLSINLMPVLQDNEPFFLLKHQWTRELFCDAKFWKCQVLFVCTMLEKLYNIVSWATLYPPWQPLPLLWFDLLDYFGKMKTSRSSRSVFEQVPINCVGFRFGLASSGVRVERRCRHTQGKLKVKSKISIPQNSKSKGIRDCKTNKLRSGIQGKHNPWTMSEQNETSCKGTLTTDNDKHLRGDDEDQVRVIGAGEDYKRGKHCESWKHN